jgi:hypothetical protein
MLEDIVSAHNRVALRLTPGVLRVTLVKSICAHGGCRAEWVHVRRAREWGTCTAERACHSVWSLGAAVGRGKEYKLRSALLR